MSRLKALESLVEWTDPLGTPGEKYSYSDTGYVLLGAIVERVTGQDLPRVVRGELELDTIAPDTYWERFERARGPARAHQMFQGIDTYDWNPSMDLFGGGGLVASTQDTAAFFDALLRGKLLQRQQSFDVMRSRDGLPQDSPYGLGLFTDDFEGVSGLGHSGFWGTFVVHEPKSQRTIAGAVTDGADFPKLKRIVSEYVRRSAASVVASSAVPCEAGAQLPLTTATDTWLWTLRVLSAAVRIKQMIGLLIDRGHGSTQHPQRQIRAPLLIDPGTVR